MWWGRRAREGSLTASVLAVGALVAAGCVGVITRDEFDDELRMRLLTGGAAGEPSADRDADRDADGADDSGDGVTSPDGADLPDAPSGGPSLDGPLGSAGAFPQVAIAQILERTGGGDDLEVWQMTFELDSMFGVVEARNPARPDEYDLYVFENARLAGSEPVQRRSGDRIEERLFRTSSIPFDRLDEMAATALAELDQPDARVTSLTWASVIPGQVDVVIGVASERARETVRFSLDGELVRGLS